MGENGEGRQDTTAQSHQERRSLQTEDKLCTLTLPGKMNCFIGEFLHGAYKSRWDTHREEWAAVTKPWVSLNLHAQAFLGG